MAKTLIIAEQSEIIRKGLIQIAESFGYFDKIREVACASGLDDQLARYCPDVLLLNPSFIPKGLPEILPETCNGKMKLGAIVYSLFDDELISQFDELIMINDTRNKIQKKISNLINKAADPKAQKSENTLSSRELDVLKLLVKGMSNKEISDKLFISTHTVISHRKNITHKLNIKSVAGLTVYAILNDIISIDDVK
jgi:two-component system, NarL family, response regulator NreC